MTRAYSINWLELEDAAEVARLEAQIHTADHRAGQQVIAAQLIETAEQGRNLSLGLYFGTRLVGFGLVFLARSRREVASFFDAPVPEDLSADEAVIYIADFAVLPQHRRMSNLLYYRFARLVQQRDDLRSLCVEAFSTEEYLAFWIARAQFVARRMGLQFTGRYPFHDARLGTTMYWLSLRPTRAAQSDCAPAAPFKGLRRCKHPATGLMVGEIDTGTDSSALAPQWNALLARTPHSTVMQHYSYLHSWWTRCGALKNLLIPTVVRDGVAVAIAPMQIEESRWLGKPLSRLTFMESPPDVSCVSALVPAEEAAAIAALADYIVTEQRGWDSIVLTAQRPDDPFLRALEARMRAAHLPVSIQPGLPIPCVPVTGSWTGYLAGRSAVFRERLAAAERASADIAGLRFETCDPTTDLVQALERFTAIETHAPDDRRDAASATSASVSFFRLLAARYGDALGMQFGFLAAGTKDLAAVLGFALNRSFYPLHVTWDDAYSAHDPGLLVMSRQLQRIFDGNECDIVILSSRAVPARADWASLAMPTVSLYGSRSTVSGWLLHAAYSIGKPWLKRLVSRASATP